LFWFCFKQSEVEDSKLKMDEVLQNFSPTYIQSQEEFHFDDHREGKKNRLKLIQFKENKI